MTRFVVVPQWQGSPSSRAMLLIDGAEAIAGDLPRSAVTRIAVPLESGEGLGWRVHRLSALERVRALLADELAAHSETVVVVGGDCGVAVPAVDHAAARHPNLAVVWFDAHADLHSPDTSVSGAFSGMALRAIAGDGALALGATAVAPGRIVVAGSRDRDVAESAYIAEEGIRALSVDDLSDPTALLDAVTATGADAVYIHVDLDVLDPAVITGVTSPVPFGLDVATLVASISRVRERMPLVGASLAGFAPATPDAAVDDLGAVLRVVGALA